MSWDYNLLKKFSNTSHFRLLNQVRSELKAYALYKKKEAELKKVSNTSSPKVQKGVSEKSITEFSSYIDSKSNHNSIDNTNNQVFSNFDNSTKYDVSGFLDRNKDTNSEEIKKTFRDRLNDIDMR